MDNIRILLLFFFIILIILTCEFKAVAKTGKVQLVAVQMELNIQDYWSEEAFADKIEELMARVNNKTEDGLPTLVVFPEFIGLMLVAQGYKESLEGVTTIDSAIKKISISSFLPIAWTKIITGLPWVPSIFYNFHQKIGSTYFKVFTQMAKKYNSYIIAGSVILPRYEIDNGEVIIDKPLSKKVYNTSYLFNPDGKVEGRQDKINLMEIEREGALNLSEGKIQELEVFATEVGNIGIAICYDAFIEEVIEKLVQKDANILIQPSANNGKWTVEQQKEWLLSGYKWTYLEKKFKYAVNPMLVGSLWDVEFYGQSSIITDNESEEKSGFQGFKTRPGFLKAAETSDEEEIMVIIIDKH